MVAANLAQCQTLIFTIEPIEWLVFLISLARFDIDFTKKGILNIGMHRMNQRTGEHGLQQVVSAV